MRVAVKAGLGRRQEDLAVTGRKLFASKFGPSLGCLDAGCILSNSTFALGGDVRQLGRLK